MDEKIKKIRFSNIVNVILIPTYKEYIEQNISKDLWYDNNFFTSVRNEVVNEIKVYSEKHDISFEDAYNKILDSYLL